MVKKRVLFLCTGNSARSQMAEALLRQYGGEGYEAFSAGLEPKGINPFAVQAMKELGIDISGQRSKNVSEYLGKLHVHYMITLCDDAEKNCPTVWPGVLNKMHWSFEDPAAFVGTDEEKLAKFCEIRDLIGQRLQNWVEENS
jgi:arsenate reductase